MFVHTYIPSLKLVGKKALVLLGMGGEMMVAERREAVSVKIAQFSIRASDKVAYALTRFFLLYAAICCLLLRELRRRPTCGASERSSQGCVWPMVPLQGRIDLFVVVSLPGDRNASVAMALCNRSGRAKLDFEAQVRIDSPAKRGVPLIATIYARQAVSSEASDTVDSVVSSSVLLGSTALTRPSRVMSGKQRRKLLHANSAPDQEAGSVKPHWRFGGTNTLTIRVLDVGGDEALSRHVAYDGLPKLGIDGFGVSRSRYDPSAFIDEQSLLSSHETPLPREANATKLRFAYRPESPLVFGLRNTVSRQLIEMAKAMLPDSDVDDLRYHLSDRGIFRYVLSQTIGLAHVCFDYLAFREDVGFYVGRETFKGISTSSLVWNFFRSIVVYLYLADRQASKLVLFSVGSSTATQLFKVVRILQPTFSYSFPFMHLKSIGDEEKELQYTHHLDRVCTRHLGIGLAPILPGFAMYTLFYNLHKSWYSWAISSLADCTYFFGFLAMVPQLYINYKLKSVAHLPIRVFLYKIFNTFIDDAFAFLVKMPTKHRVMTLRDDLVFLVFLYQYWIYHKDTSRPNEFGIVYKETKKEENGTASTDDDQQEAKTIEED